jgi:hypothetical protein
MYIDGDDVVDKIDNGVGVDVVDETSQKQMNK